MPALTRRHFLSSLAAIGGGSLAVRTDNAFGAANSGIKPIRGSWFEFQHHSKPEGVYWNPALAAFTKAQWEAKVKEMADAGLEYLVLLCTALYYKAFYDTKIFPKFELVCPDPIETVLSAADKYGVKFFMGGGFYGDWEHGDIMTDPEAAKRCYLAIEELAGKYGHHRSFYGWYWSNEACINPVYEEKFIDSVNACSKVARAVQPKTRILIAPYGTRLARPDDAYVRQLERLDVDIIAYQDEVGVQKSKPEELPAFYEGLRKAHNRAPQRKIWADMEIFSFEGEVYKSALLPAPFERVEKQLTAISPFVDTVLVYQYQGMMNKPGSQAFAGPESSTKLYTDYVAWKRKKSIK